MKIDKILVIITTFSVSLFLCYEFNFMDIVIIVNTLLIKILSHNTIIIISFIIMMIFHLFTWAISKNSVIDTILNILNNYNIKFSKKDDERIFKLSLSIINEYSNKIKESVINKFKKKKWKCIEKGDHMASHLSVSVYNTNEKTNPKKEYEFRKNNHLKNYSIILASGNGSRYKNSLPKQFAKIAGKTVLEHTIEIFENSNKIDSIIVVINPEYRVLTESILLKNNYKKVEKLINGGTTRKESSYIGINSIEEDEANVIIHDCARPFLTQEIISNCMEALNSYDAVDVANPPVDPIVEV